MLVDRMWAKKNVQRQAHHAPDPSHNPIPNPLTLTLTLRPTLTLALTLNPNPNPNPNPSPNPSPSPNPTQAHHLSPEHLDAPGWPVPLTTSRADLKVPTRSPTPPQPHNPSL